MMNKFLLLLSLAGLIACTKQAGEPDNLIPQPDTTRLVLPEQYDFVITPETVKGNFKTFFQDVVRRHKKVLIKNGTYDITLTDNSGVRPKDSCTIVFEPKALIRVKPNNLDAYCVIDLTKTRHVTLINPAIEGDKYTHRGTTGQWGFGIRVTNCSNVVIRNARISKCWGDGLYLSDCNRVRIYKPLLTDNRRQGISIISGHDIEIYQPVIENTGGTDPGYGIDIEPNWNGEHVTGLRVYNGVFRNNGTGTHFNAGFCLSGISTDKLRPSVKTLIDTRFEVELYNPVFYGDALLVAPRHHYVTGYIKVVNPVFYAARTIGLYLLNVQSERFSTEIINPRFENCVQATRRTIYQAPILFYCNGAAKNGTCNVTIKNPVVIADGQATFRETAIRNITFGTYTEDMKNVVVTGVDAKGYRRIFYNHSGDPKRFSALHPTFSLTTSGNTELPSLKSGTIVGRSVDYMIGRYTASDATPAIYLTADIPVSNAEFYYINQSASKASLRLLFGTSKAPGKARIDPIGAAPIAGIELPYGAAIRMRKEESSSDGIQHWSILSDTKSVRPIR